jgi:hypothetical protein
MSSGINGTAKIKPTSMVKHQKADGGGFSSFLRQIIQPTNTQDNVAIMIATIPGHDMNGLISVVEMSACGICQHHVSSTEREATREGNQTVPSFSKLDLDQRLTV